VADEMTTQICAQDDKVADATRSINELQLRRSLVESSLQVTNEVIPGIVSQLLSISD
jgi:hypothetical protein